MTEQSDTARDLQEELLQLRQLERDLRQALDEDRGTATT